MVMLAMVAVSSFFMKAYPTGSVEVKSLQVILGKQYRTSNDEFGFTRFDIDADLKPLFNWNTKQVFAYLVADYTGANNATHTIVVWDRIVRRKRDAHLSISSGRSKYPLRDLSGKFEGASAVNFRLMYNVMPWVGMLTYSEAAQTETGWAWPPAKKAV